MHDKQELCNKIKELYPAVGECDIDVLVDWDADKKTWVVDLHKDNHELKHYLADVDADDCMDDRQCVSLGLEIAQLVRNIKGEQY